MSHVDFAYASTLLYESPYQSPRWVGCRRLTPLIPATWEAEIWTITFRDQLGQKGCETPSQPIASYSGIHLSSQLFRGLKSGGLRLQVIPVEKICETPISMGKKLRLVAHPHPPSNGRRGSRLVLDQEKSKTLSQKQPEQKGWRCGSSGLTSVKP
jgi:hypothetical protein